jgi:hypothetical protein
MARNVCHGGRGTPDSRGARLYKKSASAGNASLIVKLNGGVSSGDGGVVMLFSMRLRRQNSTRAGIS